MFDIAVIGGGMAGASVASRCSENARVVLLESEDHPGYHSTGRSAAAFVASLSAENDVLRILTQTSRDFLCSPPEVFEVPSLLNQRGVLTLYNEDAYASLETTYSHLQHYGFDVSRVGQDFITGRIPMVREPYTSAALYESDAHDIDVHALHQGYLRLLKAHNGVVRTGAGVSNLRRINELWEIETATGSITARVIVNAAGAWADQLGAMAGCDPIGLNPLRRTAVLVDPPDNCDVADWPMVLVQDAGFYFKPEAGKIMVSPADEIPGPPCDAQPDELDIAIAVDYLQQALDLDVRAVSHSWAGLRSFVADRTPVVGFDPQVEGFFWMAGQGGHGIQTAPALADLAAALVLGESIPPYLSDAGFEGDAISPCRL
ncbi:FAD dependent oxidoreductase [Luminiphilus syltensis NOR5-1B]|uniref:FAD dependent oxidoreductase n=1 Tax=Luminiphilus syltensis NOR5-1B TaxID=565045 RepID=B8KSF3_9GAMM|nr:FAD dependent oxidoreductase [Luminiphilus syltensis NOR5-1B]